MKLTLAEIKEIQLNILKYIDNICKENQLKYYIAGGTLLGAVRHKGYIPWDDDIDILMPYSDYRKLIELIKKENNNYIMLNPYDNEDYFYMFSKVVDTRTKLTEKTVNKIKNYGVFVDIFPINKLPTSKEELEEYMNELYLKNKEYAASMPKKNYYSDPKRVKRIAKRILKYPYHLKCKKIDWQTRKIDLLKLLEKYNNMEEYNYSGYVLSYYGKKDIMRKEVYEDSTTLIFEGIKVKAPKLYDEYLTKLYGDYMKIPKEHEKHALLKMKI